MLQLLNVGNYPFTKQNMLKNWVTFRKDFRTPNLVTIVPCFPDWQIAALTYAAWLIAQPKWLKIPCVTLKACDFIQAIKLSKDASVQQISYKFVDKEYLVMKDYSDADFACNDGLLSQIGYVILLSDTNGPLKVHKY